MQPFFVKVKHIIFLDFAINDRYEAILFSHHKSLRENIIISREGFS